MSIEVETTVKIKVKEIEITLTLEEAKELAKELKKLESKPNEPIAIRNLLDNFRVPQPQKTWPPQDRPFWESPYSWNPNPYIVTCGITSNPIPGVTLS